LLIVDRQEEQIAHELKNYHAGQSAQDCSLAIHAKICQFATHMPRWHRAASEWQVDLPPDPRHPP
jgi:hypothetical protein